MLTEEAARQIRPDGSGAEQSVAYQIFATELMLVPAALLPLRGDPSRPPILDALRRSADYLRELGHPLPRYGDEDGGFALRLHADPRPGRPAPRRDGGRARRLSRSPATIVACWPGRPRPRRPSIAGARRGGRPGTATPPTAAWSCCAGPTAG